MVAVVALCSMTFLVMSARSLCDPRANNLQPKLKQLGVVLTTVDTAEQGVGRAEGIEAIADDYANGAEVMRFKLITEDVCPTIARKLTTKFPL